MKIEIKCRHCESKIIIEDSNEINKLLRYESYKECKIIKLFCPICKEESDYV